MKHVTIAESLILEALWSRSPQTAEEIARQVGKEQKWTEATVRTFLGRLVKKKAIAAKKDGRRFLYRPLIKRSDYLEHESKSLIDRLFDGRLAPLVTHFSARRKLSVEDIAELKQLLRKIENDG